MPGLTTDLGWCLQREHFLRNERLKGLLPRGTHSMSQSHWTGWEGHVQVLRLKAPQRLFLFLQTLRSEAPDRMKRELGRQVTKLAAEPQVRPSSRADVSLQNLTVGLRGVVLVSRAGLGGGSLHSSHSGRLRPLPQVGSNPNSLSPVEESRAGGSDTWSAPPGQASQKVNPGLLQTCRQVTVTNSGH